MSMHTTDPTSTDSANLDKEFFDSIQKRLDGLPAALARKAQGEWEKISRVVLEKRPPRIAVIGRRGAGKSSLLNAIFQEKVADVGDVVSMTGASTWHVYQGKAGKLQILDTRGLGDRTHPEDTEHEDTREDLLEAVAKEMPDIILFLCKAKEVDARIEEDVRGTLQIQQDVERTHSYRPPIIGLVTQVDELSPKSVSEPPYSDSRKRENIDLACKALRDSFAEKGSELDKVLPISACIEYEDNEEVSYSNVWNVDTLVEYLVTELPESARLMMARTSMVRSVQRRMAEELVKSAAVVCAGIAATPIPVADSVPITAAQMAMITGVAFVSGRSATKQTATEFISAMGVNVGAAFVFREAARALVKLIPVAGSGISAGVAFGATWALGQAAILYFIDGASAEQARHRRKTASDEVERGDVETPKAEDLDAGDLADGDHAAA